MHTTRAHAEIAKIAGPTGHFDTGLTENSLLLYHMSRKCLAADVLLVVQLFVFKLWLTTSKPSERKLQLYY